MKLLEALIILVLIGVLAAMLMLPSAKDRAYVAQITTLQGELGKQRDADTASAGAHEAQCAAQVASAVKAGAAIARLAVPHARTSATVQSMYSAADIWGAMQ